MVENKKLEGSNIDAKKAAAQKQHALINVKKEEIRKH
jgi:hypothetical protein